MFANFIQSLYITPHFHHTTYPFQNGDSLRKLTAFSIFSSSVKFWSPSSIPVKEYHPRHFTIYNYCKKCTSSFLFLMNIIIGFLAIEENWDKFNITVLYNNYSPALGCSNSISLIPALLPLVALLLEPLTAPAAVGLGWEEEGEEMEVGFKGFLTLLSFLLQYVRRYSCGKDIFRCDVKNIKRKIFEKCCIVLYCG